MLSDIYQVMVAWIFRSLLSTLGIFRKKYLPIFVFVRCGKSEIKSGLKPNDPQATSFSNRIH